MNFRVVIGLDVTVSCRSFVIAYVCVLMLKDAHDSEQVALKQRSWRLLRLKNLPVKPSYGNDGAVGTLECAMPLFDNESVCKMTHHPCSKVTIISFS